MPPTDTLVTFRDLVEHELDAESSEKAQRAAERVEGVDPVAVSIARTFALEALNNRRRVRQQRRRK